MRGKGNSSVLRILNKKMDAVWFVILSQEVSSRNWNTLCQDGLWIYQASSPSARISIFRLKTSIYVVLKVVSWFGKFRLSIASNQVRRITDLDNSQSANFDDPVAFWQLS